VDDAEVSGTDRWDRANRCRGGRDEDRVGVLTTALVLQGRQQVEAEATRRVALDLDIPRAVVLGNGEAGQAEVMTSPKNDAKYTPNGASIVTSSRGFAIRIASWIRLLTGW
jgi:hypothetical protein